MEENRRYLKGNNSKLGRFYLLPKIHKRLVNVPGRLVITNCGTATEELLELVDFYIQAVVKNLPHIAKDTTDFLCKLKELGDISDNGIICTMDVVGLYPDIPHEEGLMSMKNIMEKYRRECKGERKPEVTIDDLVDLVRWPIRDMRDCFFFLTRD